MDPGSPSIVLEDIAETRRLIEPFINRTPVHQWRGRELEALMGSETSVVAKLELFQRTGTFKARGALSVALRAAPEKLARGVTAVSAGNHAIAAAYTARVLGTSAKVVMLASANPARVEACKAYGAEVLIAPDGKTAFEWAAAIERDEGRTFIHPFEGPYTSLGTATLGAEWSEQAGPLDAIVVPIGGGGLCSGVAAAFKLLQPDCRVYAVEPEGADSMYRSFAAGSPQTLERIDTIADSLAPPYALPYSFAMCRANVDELVLISDDAMRDAMRMIFRELKFAVEPAAAAATAAMIGPLRTMLAGKRVGVILCGTNIDLETFTRHVG